MKARGVLALALFSCRVVDLVIAQGQGRQSERAIGPKEGVRYAAL